MPPHRRLHLLPADIAPERVAATLGLISDTHLPDRLDELPRAILDALAGVDLVLHAGDVGQLRVLDELSRVAPVVAVHGNDDTPESQRELPYQIVVAAGGARILLCHSHNPDRVQELASRASDDVEPKLSRRAGSAQGAGASILAFGHWHTPLALERDGVLLVNPGAIASPNYVTRQMVRTVARLFVLDDGSARVVHVDLEAVDRAYASPFDPAIGFRRNLAHFSEPL